MERSEAERPEAPQVPSVIILLQHDQELAKSTTELARLASSLAPIGKVRAHQDAFSAYAAFPATFSSFLQKGSLTMADADRLGKIASIGQDLITTQLTMA